MTGDILWNLSQLFTIRIKDFGLTLYYVCNSCNIPFAMDFHLPGFTWKQLNITEAYEKKQGRNRVNPFLLTTVFDN